MIFDAHRRIRLCLFASALVIVSAGSTSASQVTGQADRQSIRVGDTLTVTVKGMRVGEEASFIGATVVIPSNWLRGGQVVSSPVNVGDTTTKQWQFQLIPTVAGSTTVIPIVLFGAEVALGAPVDSVVGAPIRVIVQEERALPIWPLFLGGAILVVVTLAVIVRTIRQRRAAEYERSDETPLEEALRMLDTIRVNRREDRARQYLMDLENVIHGYVTRRLGRSITGLTPTEIGRRVGENCRSSETVDELTTLLKRCAESKFGGVDIRFDILTGIEGQARGILERLDTNWV